MVIKLLSMSVTEPLLNHKELRNHDPCIVLVLLAHTLSLQNDFLSLLCTSWSVNISFYCLLISLMTTSNYLVLLNRETCCLLRMQIFKRQENTYRKICGMFFTYILSNMF